MTDHDHPPEATPWGEKYEEIEVIPGFWMVSTSGHGGLYLTIEQREAIPEDLKMHSPDGKGTWWEEDCAWSLPVICLLSKRPEGSLSEEEEEWLEQAHSTARNNFPDEWEYITGCKIMEGESYERDQQQYLISLGDSPVAVAAWGSYAPWVPAGMVGVGTVPAKACLEHREAPARFAKMRYFLVPDTEYEPGLFAVDPARHRDVTSRAERSLAKSRGDDPRKDKDYELEP